MVSVYPSVYKHGAAGYRWTNAERRVSSFNLLKQVVHGEQDTTCVVMIMLTDLQPSPQPR